MPQTREWFGDLLSKYSVLFTEKASGELISRDS